MIVKTRATIEDLYRVPDNGKAELVKGELVREPPTGGWPARSGGQIYIHLWMHERQVGGGMAFPDNTGFHVDLPERESFSPDAAWHPGPLQGLRFVEGAPLFAAEIRSENDYGPRAEQNMADKRADYFAAGTLVVWDVDLLSPDVIRKYTADDPEHPTIFRREDIADAEPAVPGWRMAVDDLF
jgi:Uma2 family endonuclease